MVDNYSSCNPILNNVYRIKLCHYSLHPGQSRLQLVKAWLWQSNKFIFRGNVSGRVTRSSQQLNIQLFKTKTGQRSFSYRIVNIWNNLPSEIMRSQCLNSFNA